MTASDAHIHLFAGGYPGRYGHSPAGGDELAAYLRLREAHDIDRALVVGYEGGPRFVGNNDHLAALAARQPWIAPVAYVPPAGPSTVDELRARLGQGFVGLSAYLPGPAEAAALAGWPAGTAATLNAAAAVVSLNATPAAATGLADAVARLDGCTVLFSHLGLPGPHPEPPSVDRAAEILAPLRALAGLPHVGVKISGLYAVSDPSHAWPHAAAAPFVRVLLDTFGPGRLYWGSDFAPSLDAVSFPQTLDLPALAGLSPAKRDAVYGGNLVRALDRVILPDSHPR
ncbi:amidohydrolase family protein [Polymorphospora lycopeni]|uniref:Amidohydrolase family protein n=1 Tax=Polymorphospora lycopeni TaxID=3140240 RepID=A0ABV5CZ70_9ACTN